MSPPPRSAVEGREFRFAGRWLLSGILVGTLLFLVGGTLAAGGPVVRVLAPGVGLFALMTLPMVAYVMTSVMTLRNGVLTRRSALGTKRIELARVRGADLRVVSGRAGPREQLTLVERQTMRLGEQREDWPILRDAILAELPLGVRPGDGKSPRPAVRLNVESALPQRPVEGRVFRREDAWQVVFVLGLVLAFGGFLFAVFSWARGPWVAAPRFLPLLLILPMMVGSATEHAVLRGGTLTVGNAFRKRRIALADVRRVEYRPVARGRSRHEGLFLVEADGRETKVPTPLVDQARLVDAILAGLPPGLDPHGAARPS